MGVRQYALTVREAAEVLGVSEWLIREECRTGRLFSVKVRGRIGEQDVGPPQLTMVLMDDK